MIVSYRKLSLVVKAIPVDLRSLINGIFQYSSVILTLVDLFIDNYKFLDVKCNIKVLRALIIRVTIRAIFPGHVLARICFGFVFMLAEGNNNNNNNSLHLYRAFLFFPSTQSAQHCQGGGVSSSTTSVQHPPG